MTYSKSFTPSKYTSISTALEKLQSLKPGARAVFVSVSPEAQARLRYLLYDYLHHSGLKAAFRLKTLGPTELMLQRLHQSLIRRTEDIDEKMSPYVEALIEVWGTGRAEALIGLWKVEKDMDDEEATALWARVSEIMT